MTFSGVSFSVHLEAFSCFIVQGVMLSCSVVSDSATPWTVAHQALLSVLFPRQEYGSG